MAASNVDRRGKGVLDGTMIALGLTDYNVAPDQLVARGMTWTRIITTSQADPQQLAQRIRDAKNAGLKVVLTVGGIGTEDRKPSFKLALALIQRLPQADGYTIDNEPDLDGTKPCAYRKGWMAVRRVLGRKLYWGDFSPHRPLTFTQAAAQCGSLPKQLTFAIHPYQLTDPLAPPVDDSKWAEGGIGHLRFAKRWLKRNVGIDVQW